jgi:subtilase family serine protease
MMNNSFLPKNKKRGPLSIKRLLGLILGFSVFSSTLFAQRDLTVSLTSVKQVQTNFTNTGNFESYVQYVANFKTTATLPANFSLSVGLFLSTDNIASADDILVLNVGDGGLGEQLSRVLSFINTDSYSGIAGVQPNGNYYFYLKTDYDNQVAETNENNNTSNLLPFNLYGLFCQSKGTTPWNNWIQNVSVGTLNNASEKGRDVPPYGFVPGYSNFLDLPPTTFAKGQSYPFTITPGVGYVGQPNGGLFFRVWIDSNGDGIYSDTEQVLEKTSANIAVNQTITIPATAKSGVTGMRVSMKAGGYPFSCETFDLGEVEDYLVNLTGATVAPDLTVSNVIAPAFIRVNETLNFSYRVKNVGTAAAVRTFSNRMSSVGIFSNPDNGTSFGFGSTEKLTNYPIGFDSLVNFSRLIQQNVPVGTYILQIEVDPDLSIGESNEANNIIRIPFEVRAAATDNQKLIVTAVAGSNRVEPNGVLSVNVTVKNNATVPSVADSLYIASWVATGLGAGAFYSTPYSKNKIAVPAIAANQSVTIPASFTMPATLSSNVYAVASQQAVLLEPYFITKTVAEFNNSGAPIPTDSAKRISYNYPILPASTADLVLTGSQINTTWDSANPVINTRLRVTNNGPNAANNITVQINALNARFGNPPIPAIANFNLTSGGGTFERRSVDIFNSISVEYWGWKIPNLPAGASIEATFTGSVATEFSAPQTATFYYKDLTIKPKILYADALDNNKANDSISGGLTYRFVPSTTSCANDVTPPVYTNCPQNVNLAISGTRAFATWTPPTATDNCTLVSNLGTINPPFSFGLGSTPVTYTATDAKNNTSTCRFNVVLTQSPTLILPDLTFTNFNLLTTTAKGGDSLRYNYSVYNGSLGSTPANTNFFLQSFISTDNVLSANDIPTNPTAIFGETIGQQNYANGSNYAIVPTTLAAGTYYLLTKVDATNVITESSEGNNVISGVFTVTAMPTGTYCASKAIAPWELWTSNVTINTLNNTSDKFKDINTLGYSDYTNLSTSLSRGQTYPISVTPSLSWVGNTGNAYCRVWIDFNNNKTFEANELVLEKNSSNLFSANVLIPTTATLGNVRMRVAMKWGAFPTACETFDRGEVEDYTVTITNATVDVCSNFTFETRNIVWNGTTVQYDIRGLGVIGNYIPHVDYRELRPDGTIVNTGVGNTSSVWFTVNEYIGNLDTLKNAIILTLPTGDCRKPYTFIRPTNSTQPDLTLQNLTVAVSSVQQGQILNFKVDAKNIGTAAATGNFTIKSYLSTDNVLSANDYADGSVPTGNYAAGFSVAQIPAAMTVRNTLAAGQYYLILKIDADNQIAESNENNNVIVATGLITVTTPTTGGGADIALTMTGDPSVYRAYTTNNFRISAKNNGTTAFTNVKIKFTKPVNTVAGGTKVASIGTFQDFCPGGIECSEWTIPTLAGGATATLDAPIFILAPTGAITATATLLSSTPTDANAANNTATVTLNQATVPAVAPLVVYKPTQLIPVVIQKVSPTITESEITVELESLIEKTVEFGISNAVGQVVLSQQVPIEKGMNKATFDVSALPQGLYFIQTNVGKGRNVPTKFIKM